MFLLLYDDITLHIVELEANNKRGENKQYYKRKRKQISTKRKNSTFLLKSKKKMYKILVLIEFNELIFLLARIMA